MLILDAQKNINTKAKSNLRICIQLLRYLPENYPPEFTKMFDHQMERQIQI
jgi:hypothetical protein